MKIGNFDLNKKVLVVAEIGNNHEGNFLLAKKLIRLASASGADAVKFQTIVPENLVSAGQKNRMRELERFALTYSEFTKLAELAKQEKVLFLSTPFDVESARFLSSLVPAFKIASADSSFLPLIEIVARTGKPILLSTGLSNIEKIKISISFIKKIWRDLNIRQEIALLHCVTSYPVPPKEANLLAIRTLIEKFGVIPGYSDHTVGIDAAVLSVALGARIVEKHFTLDKNYSDFHDHKISADPEDFSRMVEKIKLASEMLGDGIKRLQKSEKKLAQSLCRRIVAKHDLRKGTVLSTDDIKWVRSEKGLTMGRENEIVRKRLSRPIKKGNEIYLSDICAA